MEVTPIVSNNPTIYYPTSNSSEIDHEVKDGVLDNDIIKNDIDVRETLKKQDIDTIKKTNFLVIARGADQISQVSITILLKSKN